MSLFGSLFKSNDSPLSTEEISSPLDLVTYAGSLASNPPDIDPLLDPVRKITATHPLESGLSPADETELLKVYLELEVYLTSRDPIRTFTKEELRGRLSDSLSSKLATYETKGDA